MPLLTRCPSGFVLSAGLHAVLSAVLAAHAAGQQPALAGALAAGRHEVRFLHDDTA